MIRKTIRLAAAAACVCALSTAPAQAADAPDARDPEIARLVREVSAARLEGYVRTLAGFGTRHSLSAADDPKRGIGAARRWIKETLDRCAAETGARLKVEFDEFVQPPTPRVQKPATLVNVVATLEGVDPVAKARTLVVSGHYDSMCGNVMNAQCDAPGANDDASGTAVVMELACTMAKTRNPATLVFMAVAGEEQGLLGAFALGAGRARAQCPRRGDDHQRHRRQFARRDRASATPARCGSSPKASPRARSSPRNGSAASRPAARTIRRRASSPGRCATPRSATFRR